MGWCAARRLLAALLLQLNLSSCFTNLECRRRDLLKTRLPLQYGLNGFASDRAAAPQASALTESENLIFKSRHTKTDELRACVGTEGSGKTHVGSWNKNFGMLICYREKNGHCNVPTGFKAGDGSKLGDWVSNQRQAYRKGSLSEERSQRLNEAGLALNPTASTWEDNFQRFERYTEEHGDCSVSRSFETKDGVKLGVWVSNQRQARQKGSLSEERSRRLNEAGLAWNPPKPVWEDGFQRLEQYIEEHGDCLVPKSFETNDGAKLGAWVGNQRHARRMGTLSEERSQRLNKVGFVWSKLRPTWEDSFHLLEQYINIRGDCLVPFSFRTQDGFRLGLWVYKQREAHRKGSLSEERTRYLNEVGLPWNPFESAWQETFQLLEQYIDEHGDCSVPQSFVTKEGNRLGDWVSMQRQAHRKGSLSEERTRHLNKVGLAWNPTESAWEETFQLLEQYIKDHGDCLVPKSFETKYGYKLGNWVSNQRHRKGSLSKERLQRLNDVEFAWKSLESR